MPRSEIIDAAHEGVNSPTTQRQHIVGRALHEGTISSVRGDSTVTNVIIKGELEDTPEPHKRECAEARIEHDFPQKQETSDNMNDSHTIEELKSDLRKSVEAQELSKEEMKDLTSMLKEISHENDEMVQFNNKLILDHEVTLKELKFHERKEEELLKHLTKSADDDGAISGNGDSIEMVQPLDMVTKLQHQFEEMKSEKEQLEIMTEHLNEELEIMRDSLHGVLDEKRSLEKELRKIQKQMTKITAQNENLLNIKNGARKRRGRAHSASSPLELTRSLDPPSSLSESESCAQSLAQGNAQERARKSLDSSPPIFSKISDTLRRRRTASLGRANLTLSKTSDAAEGGDIVLDEEPKEINPTPSEGGCKKELRSPPTNAPETTALSEGKGEEGDAVDDSFNELVGKQKSDDSGALGGVSNDAPSVSLSEAPAAKWKIVPQHVKKSRWGKRVFVADGSERASSNTGSPQSPTDVRSEK